METLTLISLDNHKIVIDSKSAQKSTVLKKKLLENNDENINMSLTTIKYDILKRIVEYLNYYKNKTVKQVPKPTPSENLNSFLDDWDLEYINGMNLDETFELMNAASDLGIQSLLDLASTKVASILKNKGIEDIRNMFSTGCDLSEKELKKYEEISTLIFN